MTLGRSSRALRSPSPPSRASTIRYCPPAVRSSLSRRRSLSVSSMMRTVSTGPFAVSALSRSRSQAWSTGLRQKSIRAQGQGPLLAVDHRQHEDGDVARRLLRLQLGEQRPAALDFEHEVEEHGDRPDPPQHAARLVDRPSGKDLEVGPLQHLLIEDHVDRVGLDDEQRQADRVELPPFVRVGAGVPRLVVDPGDHGEESRTDPRLALHRDVAAQQFGQLARERAARDRSLSPALARGSST